MNYEYLSWAILLGSLSAASLPLGSILGLCWQPNNRIIGGMTAFGGGALFAALAVELVAPTAMHLVEAETATAKSEAAHHLINMLIGAVIGGTLFVSLDTIINSKGGFLRKTSATIEYFTNRNAARRRQIIEHLAGSELIRHLPLDIVEDMVGAIIDGRSVMADGEEGRKSVAIFTSLYESSRTGQVVYL